MRELSVERRGATTSAPLLVFPDLRVVLQQTTNLTWKHICSYTCGPRSQRLALPTRSHASHSIGHRHCSVKPSPFHLNAEAVTVLVHIFADIERLTNTRQRTHRKPPLSSSTPSPDPATFSTSLTPPSRLRRSPLHLHTKVVRTLATPHMHGECTSWSDALGLHTETPHTARVPVSDFRGIRQRRESFSHGRTSQCGRQLDNHTRFTNILSVSYCLGVFVALPFNLRRAPNGVASWPSSHTSGWHDTT